MFKIKIKIFISCALFVILTGCGFKYENRNTNTPATLEPSAPVITEPVVTPAPVPSPSEPNAVFINGGLFSLIGQPLSALKEDYGEDYYFYGVGSMSDALEYYDPFICFYSSSIISGLDGSYPDPFTAKNAVINYFSLKSDFDISTETILGQDSLRRLFLTDKKITYDLLTEELGQTPEMTHNPSGGYGTFTPFSVESHQWHTINGGTYDATFNINDYPTVISFVESDDDFIALQVTVEFLA